MTKQEQTELIESSTAMLMSDIASGKSQALTDYLAFCADFHNYSFRNCMLICYQRPGCSHVAGFADWKAKGRFVKKGEKGIAILAPLISKDKDTGETKVFGFRSVYVFDISQTSGPDLPELDKVTGNPAENTNRLKQFIDKKGITLAYEELSGILGSSGGGKIRIQTNLDPAEEFSVLVHELAHEILHHVKGEKLSKTQKETEAEAVAYVVNRFAGLNCGLASSDYIQSHEGDKEQLIKSLSRVQRTAKTIISELA